MMQSLIKLSALLLACLLNVNCAKNESTDIISVSVASLKFTSDSQSKTVSILTNASWYAEFPDWITVSPESGDASDSAQEIIVTASKNTADERRGELKIALKGGKTCALSIVQAAASEEETLSGKNFIVCANSMVYYGGLVEYGSQSEEDYGMFYKMLQDKGFSDFKVFDCTYGNHSLSDYTEAGCNTAHKDCPGVGVDLLKGLDLASFDYVIISEAGNNNSNFYTDAMTLFNRFSSVNPNVKLLYVNHIYSVYKDHKNILSQLKKLHDAGVTIVNCGQLAYDLYTGAVAVPGGSVTYKDRYTFCNHTGSDTHHPNPLMGYIMTQMLYCAISGDIEPDADWNNLIHSCKYSSNPIPYDDYYSAYYTTPAEVPFMTVIDNAEEMKGIQKLIPDYIDKF